MAVDAGAGSPDHDLAGVGVDQGLVLIAALLGQGVGDLVEEKAVQFNHLATISSNSGSRR